MPFGTTYPLTLVRAFVVTMFISALTLAVGSAHGQTTGLPQEVRINGVEFVHVPAGWFWHVVDNTGKSGDSGNKPYYRNVRIWLDGFYIAKYEARARDLKRFLESGTARHAGDYARGEREGCGLRRRSTDGEYFLVQPDQDLPATHLSWNLATEMAGWLGFRLPRETEWVKAARGTDQRAFPWGDEYPDDTFANFGVKTTSCNPVPVQRFANGKSPYGAYNMAGNVLEFVTDWSNYEHDERLRDNDRNPPPADRGALQAGYRQAVKVLKGGTWTFQPNTQHVHMRDYAEPNFPFQCFGARFAIDEDRVREHMTKGTAGVLRVDGT